MLAEQGIYFIYTVKPNDTLYGIATKLESTIEVIEQLNALYPPFTDPGLIFWGQELIVPKRDGEATLALYFVNPGDTLNLIASKFSVDVRRMINLNPQLTNPDEIMVNQLIVMPLRVHIVEEGESLWRIAKQYAVPIQAIIQANQRRQSFSNDVIFTGFGILIPELGVG